MQTDERKRLLPSLNRRGQCHFPHRLEISSLNHPRDDDYLERISNARGITFRIKSREKLIT